jgi:hypothetical protein
VGTVYTLKQLEELAAVCREYGLPLFIDGARMGYGLASEGCDVTLQDIARLADVFYIGGTKQGALFGEAVVITNPDLKKDFRYSIKQNGGMLAKGRLLGIQFLTLFEDGLYFELSRHAVALAMRIRDAFAAKGYDFLVDKTTKILQQNANVYSRLITNNKLYELLWIMFYIITNRMFSLLDKFYEKIPNNLYEEFPQIIRMAFGVKYYMMYGQNYLKLDRLIDENDASLFSPYSNYSLNNEYICGILRNCIDLNIPQLNNKMGLPIEQIIEYWGNCYSFMTLTSTEKYGGDMVLTWENLLNPYFSAEEAMERAGIDKFAKGKFKKSNKRGEIVNLSFYDFMMWDVKIKEKTQKE